MTMCGVLSVSGIAIGVGEAISGVGITAAVS
jgi:hypothetical protein